MRASVPPEADRVIAAAGKALCSTVVVPSSMGGATTGLITTLAMSTVRCGALTCFAEGASGRITTPAADNPDLEKAAVFAIGLIMATPEGPSCPEPLTRGAIPLKELTSTKASAPERAAPPSSKPPAARRELRRRWRSTWLRGASESRSIAVFSLSPHTIEKRY